MTRVAPKNAYKILGVTPMDDFATIRKTWRSLVRAYHPDVVGGCPEAAQKRFAEINNAYDQMRFHRKVSAAADESFRSSETLRADLRRKAKAEEQARRAQEARDAEARLRAEAEAHARQAEAARLSEEAAAQSRLVELFRYQVASAKRGYAGLRGLSVVNKPRHDLSA
ncbi:DnaJ domain-containing protein [Roseobacteraceae bacterium S113]